MPPRNSRNTTAPLLPHVTVGLHVANTTFPLLTHGAVGLHSPTAEATLNLKRTQPQAFPAFTPLPCLFGFFFFADHASLLLSYIPEASVRSSAGSMVLALVEELYHA